MSSQRPSKRRGFDQRLELASLVAGHAGIGGFVGSLVCLSSTLVSPASCLLGVSCSTALVGLALTLPIPGNTGR